MRTTSAARSFAALAAVLVASAAFGFACDPNGSSLTGGASGPGSASADGGDNVSGSPGSITPAGISDRRIRRLTRDEYGNTLRDLLGGQKDYGATMPADQVVHDFDGNADALLVDALFADQARMNAEDIAAAFDLNQVGCPSSQGEDCAKAFVRSFGARAMRRPVTDDEVAAYAKVYEAVVSSGGFETGIRTIVQAMLQSTGFLYRTELGAPANGGFDLTPYEVASELSYLLWRTTPDAELLQHAQSGDLSKPEVVAAQMARLLASPRANAMLDTFVDQWLYVGQLNQAQKDATTYPMWNDNVRNDMAGEAHAFFENSLRDPSASLSTLLTARYSYLTPSLAQFYGVGGGSGQQGVFTKTDMGGQRGGLLTLGSVLAYEAFPNAANPVRRGKLVRVRLLCTDMPPPPPGVAGKIPPLDPNAPNRAKFSQHDSDAACSGCHKLLDPIGFGFEKFDGIGRVINGTVDTTGTVTAMSGGDVPFDGVTDLEGKLASSSDVRDCYVRQWVRFGLGYSDTDSMSAEVTRLSKAFGDGGAKLQSLLGAIVSSPSFFHRTGQAAGSQ